jgi:hypothetical protein
MGGRDSVSQRRGEGKSLVRALTMRCGLQELTYQSILRELSYRSIATCVPRCQVRMMRPWYIRHFPHMQLSSVSRKTSSVFDIADPISGWVDVLKEIDIGPFDLVRLLSDRQESRISPYAPMAALHLMAHTLSTYPADSQVLDVMKGLPALDDMMVLLSSGLGGSAVEAAGTLAWCTVHHAEPGSIQSASPLIEVRPGLQCARNSADSV